MRNALIHSVSAFALLCSSIMCASAEQPQTVVFAFDMSDSAPVAIDPNVARSAGKFVQSYIQGMNPGDRIKIRTLGTAGVAAQQVYINANLGKRANSRPRRIALRIGELVRSLPRLATNGQIEIQHRTNIVGFLEALAPSLDCENTPTKLVIFSDGIEWSAQVKGNELLSGREELPPPSGAILKNCDVEMRGLGQQNIRLGTDSRWFPLLRIQWAKFFTAAGVTSFTAYAEFE